MTIHILSDYKAPTPLFAAVTLLALLTLAIGPSALAAPNSPALTAPRSAGGGDWPQYGHDASRTNYNPDETAIGAANVGQLGLRWQYNVGSNGVPASGSPSVANGRVYVPSSRPDGPNFFAFDAISGALAWQTSVGYIQVPCFNVGVGATPAVAGNLVIAGGGDSSYHALDAATGAERWREPLSVGPTGFPWASPLVVGGRTYLGVSSRCDNPSVRGEVRAVDSATGHLLAAQAFVPAGQAGAGIWQSPALSPDGGTLVVASGEDYQGYDGPYNRAMITLDPGSLAIRQANKQGATHSDLDYGSTPVVFHDSQGRVLVGANHKDGTFYAFVLNRVSAGPLWSRAIGTRVGMMAAYDPTAGAGGTLFIAGSGNRLYAVDPATGQDRWSATTGTVHGNMAVANGLIFLNAGADGVQILDEGSGKLLRTLLPGHVGAANSGIAIAHGFLYWLSGLYMNAWSLQAPAPTPVPPTPVPAGRAFADPAFARLWTRTDSLVAAHTANRSWFWGPAPLSGALQEPYLEGPGGQHLVQYFDKSRMEINNPTADPAGPFYVTNGLLVVELISGRLQVGNSRYESRAPAALNVAGDADDPGAPTYASFAGVANTTLGDHRATDQTGLLATATLARSGATGTDAAKSRTAGLAFVHYEPATGHNIPRVFWDFLNARGPVVANGQTVTAALITPWYYASGLPISEPYWATVRVAGQPRDVLIQAFERRVLTYNPANTAAFQVELGNVGQHYLAWRYPQGTP